MMHKLKFLLYVGVTSISINILLIYFYPNWLMIIIDTEKERTCIYPKCFGLRQERSNNVSHETFNRRIKKYRDGEQIHFEISVRPRRIIMIISNIQLINDSRDGVHIFVFNQATGSFMAHFHMDIHRRNDNPTDEVDRILQSIQDGRIIVIIYKSSDDHDSTFQPKYFQTILEFYNSNLLKIPGSENDIGAWILLANKGVGKISETHQLRRQENSELKLSRFIPLSEEIAICPNWPESERTNSRRRLCRLIEGFKSICSCSAPDTIPHFKKDLNATIIPIPIALVSVNDPHYLLRVLSKLANVVGIHPSNVLIFIDHYYEESKLIVDLFKLKIIRVRVQSNQDTEARNSFQFRTAIATMFRHYYYAPRIIVMEDSVDAADDLLYYFNQTMSLLDEDSKIFCISASKDQYNCPKTMETDLYIGEYFPSNAFMISRKLWQDELAIYWPDSLEDRTWKQWIEMYMRKSNRHCIYPMLSRLFYFGRNSEFASSRSDNHQRDSVVFRGYKMNLFSTSNYDAFLKKISDSALPWSIDKINCSNIRDFREADNITAKDQYLVLKVPLSIEDNSSRWKYVMKCFSLTSVEIRSCWYKMSCSFCYNSVKVLLFVDGAAPPNT